jgi:ribosomal protein S30
MKDGNKKEKKERKREKRKYEKRIIKVLGQGFVGL